MEIKPLETVKKKSTGKPVQGGDLVIGSIAEPTLFNSLYSTDVASSDIEERIYSFLLQTDGKLNPQLSLAEDIKESDDGKQFDVTIKKGVKFHDGEELTADDVVFTYSIPINKDYNGERGSGFEVLDSVKKTGDYSIEFKLNKKDPYFYNVTLGSYGILPKHILGDVPIKDLGENEFNRKNQLVQVHLNLPSGKKATT